MLFLVADGLKAGHCGCTLPPIMCQNLSFEKEAMTHENYWLICIIEIEIQLERPVHKSFHN